MNIGEAELAALEAEGEAFVIDAHEVHDRRLEIVDVDFVLHGVETELIALAIAHAGLHTAACHPDREGIRMMIATPLLRVRDVAL